MLDIGNASTLLRGDDYLDLDPYALGSKPYTIRPATKQWSKPEPAARPDAESYVTTLSRLRALRQYKGGWDGPGSLAASARSFDLAEAFLGLLPRFSTSFRTGAMIYAPGTAVLTIALDDLAATIEFSADGTVAAIIDDDEGEHDLDLDFDGQRIPHQLAGFLACR